VADAPFGAVVNGSELGPLAAGMKPSFNKGYTLSVGGSVCDDFLSICGVTLCGTSGGLLIFEIAYPNPRRTDRVTTSILLGFDL
jgi:hypothetical protein